MATKPIFDDIPEWPKADANPRAVIGGNKPPLEEVIPAEFQAELLRTRPDFLTKVDQAVEAARRAVAEDDDTLGKCGDLVKVYRACLTLVSETHQTVKAPYLLGGRLVDAEKNALTERLDAAKRRVESIANAYVAKREATRQAEKARRAAEERAAAMKAAAAERERERAEREAAEAAANATNDEERQAAEQRAREAADASEQAQQEAALAAAAPVDDGLVRSDAGATVGAKQEWLFRVDDPDVAYIAVSDDAKVREAIEAAVGRRVRAGARKIEGVTIWPVAKGNFR